LAFTLSACSSSEGINDARQACRQVDRSIATYRSATPSMTQTQQSAIVGKAQAQLLAALSMAAAATSADGSFNALMTTIGEGSRVPEDLLIPALQAQCKVVMSATPYLGS
jgi:hypothetical protein